MLTSITNMTPLRFFNIEGTHDSLQERKNEKHLIHKERRNETNAMTFSKTM